MFSWTEHLRETAAHLLRMANTPGWQEHAKLRRDELIAHNFYGEDLRKEIVKLQREQTAERKSSAESQSATAKQPSMPSA